MGVAGAARRVNGRAVYDSSAWHSTSMPLAATTAAGSVARDARIDDASLGRSRGDAMPVFACVREPVEDRDAGDLAAGAGRRRAGDVRRERAGHGARVAERRVDVRAKRRRVRRVQVRRLAVSITEPPPSET